MHDSEQPSKLNLPPGSADDETTLGELLRQVGKRDAPPEDFAQALKASLHEEWRVGVAERARRRTRWSFAGAAVAAMALFGVATSLWLSPSQSEPVARVVQVSGSPTDGPAGPIAAGQVVNGGDRLATTANTRLALAFNDGVSLRLDENTELLIEAAQRVTVVRGAVYVDAGLSTERTAPLILQTPYGSVRHLGTQYEVRLLEAGLSVSVREGRISLDRDDASLQGLAGEQLVVSASGNVQRQAIASDAPAWNWIGEVTPPYAIDNRPLSEFLAWAGRELGREVVFASPAAEAQAGQVVLRGSVLGLAPDQALDAVLLSTPLKAERSPGRLTIRD